MKNLILCELQRLICGKRIIFLGVVTLLAFLFVCFFVSTFGIGFYDPVTTISLDFLNFPPFILRDFHVFIIFVICPLFVVESFNKELRSGQYRMVMIRPYTRKQLFLAKILSLMIVLAVFTLILWVVGCAYSFLVLPSINQTHFFTEESYSFSASMWFNFKFYFIEFLILIGVIGIITLMSLICPNTITSYLGSVFVLIVIGFGYAPMDFLILSTKSIFDLLLEMGSTWHVILNLVVVLITGLGGSWVLYRREDYLS